MSISEPIAVTGDKADWLISWYGTGAHFMDWEWGRGGSIQGNRDLLPEKGKCILGRCNQQTSTRGTLHHYQGRERLQVWRWWWLFIYFLQKHWENNHSSVRVQSREGGATVVATSPHAPKHPPMCLSSWGGVPWSVFLGTHTPDLVGASGQSSNLSRKLLLVRALNHAVHLVNGRHL